MDVKFHLKSWTGNDPPPLLDKVPLFPVYFFMARLSVGWPSLFSIPRSENDVWLSGLESLSRRYVVVWFSWCGFWPATTLPYVLLGIIKDRYKTKLTQIGDEIK